MDEVGAPYCVTVGFDSLEDGCVTVRERGSNEQCRVGEGIASGARGVAAGSCFRDRGKDGGHARQDRSVKLVEG